MSHDSRLRADLHTHTYYSPDSMTSPRRLIEECWRKGINCLAVTDHNTIRGALAVRELAEFTVIVGEEIRSREGEVVGLFLSEDVPPGLSLEETIEHIRAQGGLVCLPHPLDRFRGGVGREALLRVVEKVDIVEAMNARTTMSRDNEEARRLAEERGLALASVSDAHSPRELGRAWVEMRGFQGPQEFLQALREGRLVGKPSNPLVHLISRYAAVRRRLGWRPA